MTWSEHLRQRAGTPGGEFNAYDARTGRSGTLMSPFTDFMNDEQIWKIVTYLRDENRKGKEQQ